MNNGNINNESVVINSMDTMNTMAMNQLTPSSTNDYKFGKLFKPYEAKKYDINELLSFLSNFTLEQAHKINLKQNKKNKKTKKNKTSENATTTTTEETDLHIFKKIWKQKTRFRPYHIPFHMEYLKEDPICIDTADLP